MFFSWSPIVEKSFCLISVMLRVGVDVGGTNTDAVVIRGLNVIAYSKQSTTKDITSGIIAAVESALRQANVSPTDVEALMLGTTHFINAIIQRKQLAKVAVLRLCRPATESILPFAHWPADLKHTVYGHVGLLHGGYDYDGQIISEINTAEVKEHCDLIKQKNIVTVAICGVFSPVKCDQEKLVEKYVLEDIPNAAITLSHEIGQIGLLERENASILNACLRPLARFSVAAVDMAFKRLGLVCPLYFTQNDGTLMNAKMAAAYPVLTFACGPTNSMRGAAFLAKRNDAIVVDIGGTSTDVGMLTSGFPRQSAVEIEVSGVRTNFRMPDVHSIGLGGGSIITIGQSGCLVGPESVGFNLCVDSLVFGGNILTATDIAVAADRKCDIIRPDNFETKLKTAGITSKNQLNRCVDEIVQMIETAIDKAKVSIGELPVIIVGGGSILVGNSLKGASELIQPPYYAVANAIGAAIAQVSGSEDCIFALAGKNRKEVQNAVKSKAIARAIELGADENTVEIVNFSEIPLAYLPSNAIRFIAKAVGDLAQRKITVNLSTDEEDEIGKVALDNLCPSEKFESVGSELPVKVLNVVDYKPKVINGKWELSDIDLEFISIGAGILGSGGGGNPYYGKLRALQALKTGKITVISPQSLKSQDLVIPCGMMGAPVIQIEKIPKGDEMEKGLKTIEELYVCKATAVIGFEIGGLNSVEPMIVSTFTGLPLVDGDGLGRAFPELKHYLPFIHGSRPYPAVMSDEKGNINIVHHVIDPNWLEKLARLVCIGMGCTAALTLKPLTADEVLQKCPLNTISQVWMLGKCVMAARQSKCDPIEAILNNQAGKCLFRGRLIDVNRIVTGGFAKGHVCIEGSDDWRGSQMEIKFQNENLVAMIGDEVLASVPDVISIVETDSARPISTEELRYGLRVSVLGIPAHRMLRSAEALKVLGPKAFGYDFDYHPLADFVEPISVPLAYNSLS